MFIPLATAFVLITGSVWCLARGFETAKALEKGRWAELGFGYLIAAALGVALRFGVSTDFQLNEHVRIRGVPIPLVVFVLEDQGWTDFVKPDFVGYPCMVADALFPVGILSYLWALVISRLRRRNTSVRLANP